MLSKFRVALAKILSIHATANVTSLNDATSAASSAARLVFPLLFVRNDDRTKKRYNIAIE